MLQRFIMGCGQSKEDPEEKAAIQANAKIEKMLRSDKKQQDRTVKILHVVPAGSLSDLLS